MTIVKVKGAATDTRCPTESTSSPIFLSLSLSLSLSLQIELVNLVIDQGGRD